MKPLTCEMCGSTNLLKQDGVFVCQSCGTKYSVEEAKKMMVEGTVAVEGTVKIDTSSELKNLYEIARRAKDTDNGENALKYYDMILVKDPSSWEANFYVIYYRAMTCRLGEIQSAAITVDNSLDSIFELVKSNVPDSEKFSVATDIFIKLSLLSGMLYNAATNHYEGLDYEIKFDYIQEYIYNVSAATLIMYNLGDKLIEYIGSEVGSFAASSWEQAIDQHKGYLSKLEMQKENQERIIEYANKAKKYNPEYEIPTFDKPKQEPVLQETQSGGCYVATAVYGSYDCPEVWTLRRFRDFALAETWYGRVFIHTYYAISPTIVKWFGSSHWFKALWHKPLDKLVKRLQAQGVESTPYQDKKF